MPNRDEATVIECQLFNYTLEWARDSLCTRLYPTYGVIQTRRAYFDRRALLSKSQKIFTRRYYASKSLFERSYGLHQHGRWSRESTPDSEYDEIYGQASPCNYLAWRGTDDSGSSVRRHHVMGRIWDYGFMEEANRRKFLNYWNDHGFGVSG